MKQQKNYWRDRNLYIIFSITLMAVMGVSSITPVLPDIRDALDLTKQQVGLMVVFFSLPGIVLTPLLGILADRYGRKTIMVPSLILFAIAGAACFLVRDFTLLLILRVLQGAGAASLGSLNTALIGDIYAKEERGKIMGKVAGVLSIGTASYPAIGGAMAMLGWYFPFLLPLLALPVGWAVLFKLNNPEPVREQKLGAYLKNALSGIKDPSVIVLFLSTFVVFIMLYGAYLTYFPLLLNDKFSASSFVIGILMTSMSATTAIVASQLGRINRHFPEHKLIPYSFLLYVTALLAIPFVEVIWLMPLPIILFGAGQGLNFPSIQARLTKMAPIQYRGIFMSVNGMILRIGQTLGPIVIGWFYAWGGNLYAFWGGAIVGLVMFFLALRFVASQSQPEM